MTSMDKNFTGHVLDYFKSQKMTYVFCQSEVHYEILFILKIIKILLDLDSNVTGQVSTPRQVSRGNVNALLRAKYIHPMLNAYQYRRNVHALTDR